jgi:hypothetical protein
MAITRTFARDLQVATAGLAPDEISKLLAQTAREALDDAQTAGEFPQRYITSVNGRVGGDIDQVEPPGPIVFTAIWWPEIIEAGLTFAEQRSPVRSGRYKSSWFVMVNGSRTDNFAAVPLDAEVIITNDQPYSRKIEVGAQRVNVPPGIVEDTISMLRRTFGDLISARRQFINLVGAYQLRTSATRRDAGQPRSDISCRSIVVEDVKKWQVIIPMAVPAGISSGVDSMIARRRFLTIGRSSTRGHTRLLHPMTIRPRQMLLRPMALCSGGFDA